MKQVWEHTVNEDGAFELSLPAGAEILSIHDRESFGVCLRMLVDPDNAKGIRRFMFVKTAQPISEPNVSYIGSIAGAFGGVHLFEIREAAHSHPFYRYNESTARPLSSSHP